MTPTLDLTTASEPAIRLWLATLPCAACKGVALTDQPCDCEGFPDVHSKMCLDCRDEDTKLSTGLALPWASEKCPDCKGRSKINLIETQHLDVNHAVVCPTCHGNGRVPKDVGLAELFEHRLVIVNRGLREFHANCGTVDSMARGETPTLAALRAIAAQAKAGMR